jgi:hypothetical protein
LKNSRDKRKERETAEESICPLKRGSIAHNKKPREIQIIFVSPSFLFRLADFHISRRNYKLRQTHISIKKNNETKTWLIRHMIFSRGGDIIAVVIMLLQRYSVNVYHDYAQLLLYSVIRRVMHLGLLFPVPLISLSTRTHFQKHTKFQYTIGLSVVFPSVYC